MIAVTFPHISPRAGVAAAMVLTMTVAGRRPGREICDEEPVLDLLHLAVPGMTPVISRSVSAGQGQPGLPRAGPAAPEPGVGGTSEPAAGRSFPRAPSGWTRPRTRRCHGQCPHYEPRSRRCRRPRTGSPSRLAHRGSHGRGPSPDAPLLPGLGVLATLLLGIHADHRLPGGQALPGLRGDVADWAIPVRVPLCPSIVLALACRL